MLTQIASHKISTADIAELVQLLGDDDSTSKHCALHILAAKLDMQLGLALDVWCTVATTLLKQVGPDVTLREVTIDEKGSVKANFSAPPRHAK